MNKIGWFFIFIFFVGVIIFLFPIVQHQWDVFQLEKKIVTVNNLYTSSLNVSEVRKKLKKSVVSSNQKKLEENIDSFLTDLVDNYSEVNDIINSEEYHNLYQFELKNDLDNDLLFLKNNREKLNNYNNELSDFSNNQNIFSYCDSNNYSVCQKLINKWDKESFVKFYRKIPERLDDYDKDIQFFDYLNNHVGEYIFINGDIEFQKRSSYDEFNSLAKSSSGNKVNILLIDDHEGPIIEADNITIYLHNNVSLDQKIKCYDAVDDQVDCQIDGSYDSSNVGKYPIHIKATDKSNNVSEKDITVNVIKPVVDKPYKIEIIRNQNVVIVYGLDENNEYTQVVKVFICSTGNATPVGEFHTTKSDVWKSLYGNVWGQYATRIVNDILFHSVPYYSPNKNDLEWEEYNKLGTKASMGCIRLTVKDSKWIYYNIPGNTTVKIYDGELPSGISKPSADIIDGSSPNKGWDPTDDDPNNPWNS